MNTGVEALLADNQQDLLPPIALGMQQKRPFQQVTIMKQYTFEEVLDKSIGKIGTPERDQFESDVDEAVKAYHIGEAIKAERLKNNLTQEQLSKRVGVQRAANITLGKREQSHPANHAPCVSGTRHENCYA